MAVFDQQVDLLHQRVPAAQRIVLDEGQRHFSARFRGPHDGPMRLHVGDLQESQKRRRGGGAVTDQQSLLAEKVDAVMAFDIRDLMKDLAETTHFTQSGQTPGPQPARCMRRAGSVNDIIRCVDALFARVTGDQPEPAGGPLLWVVRMVFRKEVRAPQGYHAGFAEDRLAEQPCQRL